MNAHDAIVDAVLAALRQQPPVTTGLIEEDLDANELGEEVRECISVSLDASNPNRTALRGHPVQWDTDVMLECYARVDGRDDGAPAGGRASRALHLRAYARLMADPSLGGVAIDLQEPQLRFDRDLLDTRLGCCVATYRVVHRTAAGSMEQPA